MAMKGEIVPDSSGQSALQAHFEEKLQKKIRPALSPSALRQRRREPELMDDPRLPPALHREALVGLERLNALSRSDALAWNAIRQLGAVPSGRPVTVLDLACGDGALLRGLHRRAGGRLRGLGIDASATALQLARQQSPDALRFRRADLLAPESWPVSGKADVVIVSLFLHHLSDEDGAALLARARRHARRVLLVLDLERGWLAWWGIWVASRLVTRSPVVHNDSALSVRAAFRPEELRRIARQAGLDGARVARRMPYRLAMTWRPKPDAP